MFESLVNISLQKVEYEKAKERFLGLGEEITPIYFIGSNHARVFAYLGIPKNAKENMPAMVLVHGGNGKAYAEWVSLWVSRGYVALSFDNNGQHYVNGNEFARNDEKQAVGYGGFNQLDKAIELTDDSLKDNWVIQTVQNAYLSFNLLASLSGVDCCKIGIAGISWGGYIVNLISGLKNPFLFLASSYAGAYLYKDKFFKKDGLTRKNMGKRNYKIWKEYFDPKNYMIHAVKPMFMIIGENEVAFSVKSWKRITKKMTNELTLVLRKSMTHDQNTGANVKELFDYADKMTKNEGE